MSPAHSPPTDCPRPVTQEEEIMQQTMLGLLSLMIVGSFTLNQHQDVAKSYGELVDDELEIAGAGVAMHIMELIGNRSFDARTLPDQVSYEGMPTGSSEMSSSSSFGMYSGCDLDEPFKDSIQCQDIDDVHMLESEWQRVPFNLKDGKELPFDVNVEVFYVDSDNLNSPLSSGQRSMHKKVVVRVRSTHHAMQHRYQDGFVKLERIFSYDKKRAENRFAEKYGTPAPPPPEDPPVEEGGGEGDPPPDDGNGEVEQDPNEMVTVCHRRVRKGKISWKTKSIKYKFLAKHIQHGDLDGACQN